MPSGRHTQFQFQFLKQVRISVQWKRLESTPNSLTSQVLFSLCCLMYFAVPLSRGEFIDLLTLENVWCVTKPDAPWTAVLKLDRTSSVTQQPSSSDRQCEGWNVSAWTQCLSHNNFSVSQIGIHKSPKKHVIKHHFTISMPVHTYPQHDHDFTKDIRHHCNQFCPLGGQVFF